MTQAAEILQLQIEPGRIAQFGNRRWIQRKNNRILDRGKPSRGARNHPLNRVFGPFSFAPIFEPSERERRVLAATVEAESRDGDETLDLGLLQKIFLNLSQIFIRSFLRRADGQLDVGDEITLFLRMKKRPPRFTLFPDPTLAD